MIQSWMTQPESVDNILSLFNLSISFSFDEAEDSILIIPRVVVGQSNGKSWITWSGDGLQPKL